MSQRTKGILYMLFSSFSFALMQVCVRMAGDLPSMQKSFFRNLFSLAVALFLIRRDKTPLRVPKGQWDSLFSRAFFGTVGVLCNFYAVDHMLISDASMLNKMSPFFATLFAIWLLKEKVTAVQLGLSLGAIGGCCLILKPSLSGLATPAGGIALLGGVCAGIAYTNVRVLGTHNVHKNIIILTFSAFSCLVTLPSMIFDYVPMTPAQFGFLLLTGVTATVGQFGITAAYCCAPMAEISVYDYSMVVFSAIFGFLFFRQVPDLLSFLGYIVICGAAVAMTVYNNHRKLVKSS